MRGFLVICGILAMIALHNLIVDGAYNHGYKQGRVDKNTEMMQALTGDPEARIAILTKDELTYHPAGICSTCHGGG